MGVRNSSRAINYWTSSESTAVDSRVLAILAPIGASRPLFPQLFRGSTPPSLLYRILSAPTACTSEQGPELSSDLSSLLVVA